MVLVADRDGLHRRFGSSGRLQLLAGLAGVVRVGLVGVVPAIVGDDAITLGMFFLGSIIFVPLVMTLLYS